MLGPNIAKALLALQAKAPQIVKNKEADAVKFKYDYADLPSILSIFKPLLTELGLVLSQPTATVISDGVAYVAVTTLLLHVESMEDIVTEKLMTPACNPQDLGKVITYLRRYQFNSLLGIAPAGEDDDCVTLVQKPSIIVNATPPGKLGVLKDLIAATSTNDQSVKQVYGVKYFDELSEEQLDGAIEMLQIKRARAA